MASSLFQLQSPWLPISWKAAAPGQPLRFVLVARKAQDSIRPELVELPGSADSRSFLAAQIDAGHHVFDWFEVQVQTSQALALNPAAAGGVLNNAILDADWERSAHDTTMEPVALAGADSAEPWVIDPQSLSVTRLVHRKTGATLQLCRDDAILLGAAKPAYGKTLQRWFKSESSSGEIHWIELGSPSPATTTELVLEAGGSDPFIDFNLSAGKILIRRHHLISLQTAIDVLRQKYGLTGETLQTGELDPAALLAQEVAHFVEQQNSGELSSPSISVGALEKLYDLLSLWKETVRVVVASCQAAKRPFLNLDLNSFRIGLGDRGGVSPRDQPNRVRLVRKASALPIEVEPGRFQFVPCGSVEPGKSLDRFGGWQAGTGTVRFSQVSETGAGTIRVEGFLDGQLLRDSSEAALVSIQTTLDGHSVNFLAQLEKDQVGARAGVRYHATISSLAPGLIKALKSTSAPRRPCQLSVLRPISPAQDIYHLGQIGLRIVMADTEHEALEVEDDIFELASLIPRTSGIEQLKELVQASDLNGRVRQLLSSKAWFPDVVGPSIPPDLWLAVLHELIEFAAIEEDLPEEPGDIQSWLGPLSARCAALERLVLHVEGLLWTPRAVDEEIGRIVHRFLPGGG